MIGGMIVDYCCSCSCYVALILFPRDGVCMCPHDTITEPSPQRAFLPELYNHNSRETDHSQTMNMYGKKMERHDSLFHLSCSFHPLHLLPLPLFLHTQSILPTLHTRYSTALLFLISYLRHPVCQLAQSPARSQPRAKLALVPLAPLLVDPA